MRFRRAEKRPRHPVALLHPLSSLLGVAEGRAGDLHEVARALPDLDLTWPASPLCDLLEPTLDAIEQRAKSPGVPGLSTGFEVLDALTGGLRPGTVALVAGRSGAGRTGFALGVVHHVAVRLGQPVLLCTMNDTGTDIAERMLTIDSEIGEWRLSRGTIGDDDWDILSKSIPRLADAPVVVEDAPFLTTSDVRARARQLCEGPGLALVVVDSLERLTPICSVEADPRKAVSNDLRIIAREFNVPVLVVASVTRKLDSAERPSLQPVAGAEGIDEDAACVLALVPADPASAEQEQEVEVLVLKNRFGPTGSVTLKLSAGLGAFVPGATLNEGRTSG